MSGKNEGLLNWLSQENEKRTGSYKRNVDDELFLRKLNKTLLTLENEIEGHDSQSYPIIFFFGLPRCGKTFLSQLLVKTLDIEYPNNIMARFWEAPVLGIKLSRILLRSIEKEISFSSDYGKTQSLFDPHDFAYFWHKWLKMHDAPYDYERLREEIEWENLGKQLVSLSREWGKTALFKAVNPSYHMKKMVDQYDKSLVIFVERDLIDSAISLRKGRLDNYNDINEWYGQTPSPEIFRELKKLPYNEQIAGQFKHLLELYENELKQIDSEKVMKINYKNFTEKPNDSVDMIIERCKAMYGVEINKRSAIDPSVIKYSRHESNTAYYKELVNALEKYDLPVRYE